MRKIFVACKTVAHLSLCVFKNRPSSLEMHVPFHGLKPIIHEMLARIDQTLSKQSRPTDSTGNVLQMLRREIHNNSRMKLTMKESIMTGLALLWPSLPTEMQSWRPLLGSASMLRKEEDNEVTAQLQGEQRTIATIDLLVAIINAFPTLTKTCVLLVMYVSVPSHFRLLSLLPSPIGLRLTPCFSRYLPLSFLCAFLSACVRLMVIVAL